jgi:hypothetical protein
MASPTEDDQRQLTAADLATMSHHDIETAREAGRLDLLLGVPAADVALTTRAREGRINADDARALAAIGRHDLIEDARASDRIDYPTSTGA